MTELTPLDRWVRALLDRPAFRAAVNAAIDDEVFDRARQRASTEQPGPMIREHGEWLGVPRQVGGETPGRGRTM